MGLGGELGEYITTYEEYKFDNDIIVNGAQHCKSELKFQQFLLDTNPTDQDQIYYNTLIIYKKYDEYIKNIENLFITFGPFSKPPLLFRTLVNPLHLPAAGGQKSKSTKSQKNKILRIIKNSKINEIWHGSTTEMTL